ncbi:MAG: hypothetical protein ACTSWY_02455 [Promethearchaeota archaeon]
MVRVTRIIIKVVILIIQISLSLVSLIGTLSSFAIIGNSNNIYYGTPTYLSYNNGTCMNITLDFGLNNTGLYDFTNLTFKAEMELHNESKDPSLIMLPLELEERIIPKIQDKFNYNSTIVFQLTEINLDEIDSFLEWEITLKIEISSFYSLDLISFSINLNITEGELEGL